MLLENVITAILFIIPGFLALELYRSFFPGKKKSEFAQVTWSLIYGVGVFTFVRWFDRTQWDYFLHSNVDGIPGARFVFALLIAGLILGLLFTAQFKLRIYLERKHTLPSLFLPDPLSIWAKINDPYKNSWAVVFLDDGAVYLGWISDFTFDPNSENHDFLLAEAKRVNEKMEVQYNVEGMGVYLNTRNVKRIEFENGKNPPGYKPEIAEQGKSCEPQTNSGIVNSENARCGVSAYCELFWGALCIAFIIMFYSMIPPVIKTLSFPYAVVVVLSSLFFGPLFLIAWNYWPIISRDLHTADEAVRVRRIVLYFLMVLYTVGAAAIELLMRMGVMKTDILAIRMLFVLTIIFIACDRFVKEFHEARRRYLIKQSKDC